MHFEADGAIKGKNDFGDQRARWTVSATKMGTFHVYSIAFPAWLAPSAALVTPYSHIPKQLGLYPMATDLQVYPFHPTGPIEPTGSTGMSVLFVQ